MTGPLANVINRAKFYLNRFRGFDSVGLNFWLPHRKEKLPLTQGLNYHSACDVELTILYLAVAVTIAITHFAYLHHAWMARLSCPERLERI